MSSTGSSPRLRVLCPLDGSSGAAAVLEKLTATLDPVGTTVLLLAVHDGTPEGEAAATAAIAAGASRLQKVGFDIEQSLAVGHAADQIVAVAEAKGTDLIVIGSRPAEDGPPGFTGRVASNVARHAPCSVLVARDDSAIGSIILGYDASPDADSAVSLLARLPFRSRPHVAVLTAYEIVTPFDSGVALTVLAQLRASRHEDLREAKSAAEALATDAAQRLRAHGFKASAHAGHGRASEQLAIFASELGADLITVGSRGLSGIERFLLGSTSSELVAIAPTSLLVTRT